MTVAYRQPSEVGSSLGTPLPRVQELKLYPLLIALALNSLRSTFQVLCKIFVKRIFHVLSDRRLKSIAILILITMYLFFF